MKVKALRGVCIGVEKHLAAGDTADLDAAQVRFLTSIGAVQSVPEDELPSPVQATLVEPDPVPAKPDKKEK